MSKTVRHYRGRKAQGLCARCPQLALPGRVHCAEHRTIALADGRRNRQRRRSAGLCTDCSAPAVAGKTLCARHREQKRVAAEQQRKKRALARQPRGPGVDMTDWLQLKHKESRGRMAAETPLTLPPQENVSDGWRVA